MPELSGRRRQPGGLEAGFALLLDRFDVTNNPDGPVYFFGGLGESTFLEQEGERFMSAAATVPSMAGSAFCGLSAENTGNIHATNLAGSPIEVGCYGYQPGAPTQMTVLESSLLYRRDSHVRGRSGRVQRLGCARCSTDTGGLGG